MSKCMNCGTGVAQSGNRPKRYCSEACRSAFRRKAKLVYPVESKAVAYPVTDNQAYPVVCFEDLPDDVQEDIEMMSKDRDANGINDYESEKAARTARALHYQELFPDGWRSGIATAGSTSNTG